MKLLPIGFVVGTMTVVGYGKDARNRTVHQVRCSCGTKKFLLRTHLERAKSCGCRTKEILRAARTRHGLTNTPTWNAWHSMHLRCTLKSRKDYANYGGRGIKVCERWQAFENFLADMGLKPSGAQLDRYPNNDGNYEPGNCRWASPSQNANNRRCSRVIEHAGERMTLIQWARRTGIPRDTLASRLSSGWETSKALSRPVKQQINNRSAVE